MHLKLTAADKSDVGKQRDQNEDKAYRRTEVTEDGDLGLFIVADGMGGYKAGEVASKLAVETISHGLDSFFQPLPEQPTVKLRPSALNKPQASAAASGDETQIAHQKTQKLSETSLIAAIESQLTASIQQANKAIIHYGEQQSGARGLGSTVTVALIQNDRAFIANVGDSRTYLLRDKVLRPLTKDHSLVARLIEAHQIAPEDIYTHPQRNLIYRSLGAGHKNIEVDIFQEQLRPGDVLLLCSDGLWEMVHHDALEKILNEQISPQAICDKLIDMANASGGEDNITAIVVQASAR